MSAWRGEGCRMGNELVKQYRRVRLFLPALLRQVQFQSAPAGAAVVAGVEYLRRRESSTTPEDVPPSAVVPRAWQRYVYRTNGAVDHRAYTLTSCARRCADATSL